MRTVYGPWRSFYCAAVPSRCCTCWESSLLRVSALRAFLASGCVLSAAPPESHRDKMFSREGAVNRTVKDCWQPRCSAVVTTAIKKRKSFLFYSYFIAWIVLSRFICLLSAPPADILLDAITVNEGNVV